ncbi:MAG: amidohydrolase family protein [Bryobacterales bacterium]|nr:amidohydrolase family protein [Bryobacterales bacterium]
MRIDAVHHYVDLSRFAYGFLHPRLHQEFRPDWIAPLFKERRFDGGIAVSLLENDAETLWLLDLADQFPSVLAVAGWVDVDTPGLAARLNALCSRPKFRGVRMNGVPGDAALREVARRGLVADLSLPPEALPGVAELAGRIPDLAIVLDGMAAPPFASGFDAWARAMEDAARHPNVAVKVSGLLLRATAPWSAVEIRPWVHHAWDCFGPDRMMFGSGWPLCLEADTWKAELAAFTQSIGALREETRAEVLGGVAARLYKIPL